MITQDNKIHIFKSLCKRQAGARRPNGGLGIHWNFAHSLSV